MESDQAHSREHAAGDEKRLHPLSWLFMTMASTKGLIGPLILVLVFSGGSNIELLSILFVFPALVSALLRYAVFRYRLGKEELVIREGLLTRNERHIPYSRIQNIDLVQNPFHRLLGVALVRLETASGQRPEAVMRVLSLEAVDELRRRVALGRQTPSEVEEGQALLRLPDIELVRLGLISNRGMLLLAALFGIFWQIGRLDEKLEQLMPQVMGRIQSSFEGSGLIWLIPAGLAVLLLLRLFSVLWYLFTLKGFSLTLRGQELRAEYGLVNQVSATIPLRRIQLVSAEESPLHRILDRVSVRLETAGSVAEGDPGQNFDARTEAPWLAPVLPRAQLGPLIRAILPEIDLAELQWLPLGARARTRLTRKSMIMALLAAVGSIPLLWEWGLALLAVGLAWAQLHGRLYTLHTAYAVADWGVAFRSGWWVRRLSVLRYAKCQSVQVSESPFDRRHGMVSLQADTAGAGKLNHRIDIPYLDGAPARLLQQRIYDEAGQRSFTW